MAIAWQAGLTAGRPRTRQGGLRQVRGKARRMRRSQRRGVTGLFLTCRVRGPHAAGLPAAGPLPMTIGSSVCLILPQARLPMTIGSSS